MECRIQPLPVDPAKLAGLSEKLVVSHHQNNYGGAVKRLNAIRGELAALDFSTAPGFRINGLKREELIAANSMALHELHFASMGGDGYTMAPAMELALAANFGSVDRWRDEFTAMGKALGGGSGWVLLVFQPRDGTLVNQWAADHAHALAGGVPLLALDMYEHAYHMDFGAQAAVWVDVFMTNIGWQEVYARYQDAVHAASARLGASQQEVGGAAILVDVRRAAVFDQSDSVIRGASWHDPALVDRWAPELPRGKDVIVYCVHGHELGRSTALRLRSHGVNARFLRGGLEAWSTAGLPLDAKAV